jgi:hypothetical protein
VPRRAESLVRSVGAARRTEAHASTEPAWMNACTCSCGEASTSSGVLAGVVAALLAPGTRWVTGQRIEVTGGYRL